MIESDKCQIGPEGDAQPAPQHTVRRRRRRSRGGADEAIGVLEGEVLSLPRVESKR
jgi:hypothetical protein